MSDAFQGVPAAGGRGAGRVYLFARRGVTPSSLLSASPQSEWQRFESARKVVVAGLQRTDSAAPDATAELRAAHLLILEDPALIDSIRAAIELRGQGAIAAVQEATAALSATIAALDDPYFAARAADVRDAGGRLFAELSGVNLDAELDTLPPDTILVADDLAPSQVARLDASSVRGIVLRRGSPLAHAAILARSLGIPMVCAMRDLHLKQDDLCLVDGDMGTVLRLDSNVASAEISRHAPPTTGAPITGEQSAQYRRTGVPASLLGNANTLADLHQVRRMGLCGVGLLRTEFLFPRHSLPPTLEEQTSLFADFLAAAPDGVFTVRALDAGGDKEIPWLSASRYPGIAGRRGVRLLLAEPELLRTQYRALLRALAAVNRPAIEPRFLLPMVTSAEEVERVRALLVEFAADELDQPAITLGAMIEAPAAVFGAGDIARQCDFLSIGSNDLTHLLFATERAHPDPDALANPLHPAVLRAFAMTAHAAQARRIPLALCGEIAGNPLATPLLVGLGVTEFSLRASSAPLVDAALGRYTLEECRALSRDALAAPDAATVHHLLED